ncbi:MAG: glycosyltransferase family 4 protein [Bacteroidia bacterium]|nr:glycosyltransferase family 4 protein [Bacteroidia bacterium]MDW8134154.1 glycosyltransferase family 4 protein [Bacteroidia bacterium]
MTKKIGLLTPYPPNTVPSLRFRIEQYITALHSVGYEIVWQSFFSPLRYRGFKSPGAPLHKRVLNFAGAFWEASLKALRASDWEGVYLHREYAPIGTTWLEEKSIGSRPFILDFDDAIWIVDTSEENRAFAWMKSPKKLPKLLSKARLVTVCNPYLAEYARQYAADVRVIPTTIDTNVYVPPKKDPQPSKLVIGWSGSFTTLRHLRTIEEALLILYRRHKDRISFRFIGVPQYHPPFPAEVLPWKAETEVEDLSVIDIGLMPLPDDEWSKGKCALKSLQYMALKIPAIVSPVGMNCQVVRDNYNGLYATTIEDWVEKVSYLIENPEVRMRLGETARRIVEEEYSVKANFSKYKEAFQAAYGFE